MSNIAKVTPSWRKSAEGGFRREQPESFVPEGEYVERILEAMRVASEICRVDLNDTLRVTFRRGSAKTARDLGTWVAITHLKISADKVTDFFGYLSADTVILTHSRTQQKLLQNEDLMAIADAIKNHLDMVPE